MIDQQPTVVSLTDAAVVKLQELTKEETNPQIGLRVYVYSGGCSGFRVVDAQQSLRQAENIRNLSLYTHANARAGLRFVMGRDPLE